MPGTKVSINAAAPVDSRSYSVDFGLFQSLATGFTPQVTLRQSIARLVDGLRRMNFKDTEFRSSEFMRLHALRAHMEQKRLSERLNWLT